MFREKTAGGSLCEGIMEGSLRAVDRTAWMCAVDSNVFSALQESNIVFCIGRVQRESLKLGGTADLVALSFWKLGAFLFEKRTFAYERGRILFI